MNIFEDILKKIDNSKKLEDEILFFMIDRVTEIFVEERKLEERQYQRLLGRLDKIWMYKSFESMTQEQSFIYGGIWGCLRMVESLKKKEDSNRKGNQVALKYEAGTMFQVLQSIYDVPGVQNKELAEICNVTTARISQITNSALMDGLITAQPMGKEKSYYIKKYGGNVYKKICEKKRRLALKGCIPDYKYICLKNSDEDFEKKWALIGNFIRSANEEWFIATAVVVNQEKKNPIGVQEFINDASIMSEERKKRLCARIMNNSNNSLELFWNQQMEADGISKLSYMK